jgi:RNA polymerase sigma-70 factor (ECF subfamily)
VTETTKTKTTGDRVSAAAPSSPVDLDALRRQDAGAFARLVTDYRHVVGGLAQAMGLRGADLDDAAAEAFAAVYKALPSFEGRSSLSTWVYKIASRAIWRVRERRPKACAIDVTDVDPSDPRATSPAQSVQRDDDRARIWASVAKLEPRQATAVELYYRFDTPIDEIAQVLDCPVNTVKTLLHRAREVLRIRLEREVR